MNIYKYTLTVISLTICLGLTACSNQKDNKSQTNKILTDSIDISATNTITKDSMVNYKLTKIYTQAIAEFIKADCQKNKTTFDTLYFGKHIYQQQDDFPDIILPEIIENTHIRLVAPDVGQKLQTERKSLIYVNMMGWVDNKKAEFILVVFKNGGQHQYDYFINFIYNSSSHNFELDTIEFENYANINGQKPKRIKIVNQRH